MWFDRYGARRTVAGAVGAGHAGRAVDRPSPPTAADLIGGRAVVGVGCAASFMSVVFLCSRWFAPASSPRRSPGCSPPPTSAPWPPRRRWPGSRPPWAGATASCGFAAVTVLVALCFLRLRARPAAREHAGTAAAMKRESFGEIVRGLLEVWTTPGLGPVLAMHFFAYATMLTVLGVWGGPYLYDVHKLDAVAARQCAAGDGRGADPGHPGLRSDGSPAALAQEGRAGRRGHLDWRCSRPAGAVPPNRRSGVAVVLLSAFCFFCAFGTVIVAQGRALFPDRLAGRGVTTVNMAQCLGLAVLPALVGYLVEAFGNGDLAYRVAAARRPRAGPRPGRKRLCPPRATASPLTPRIASSFCSSPR